MGMASETAASGAMDELRRNFQSAFADYQREVHNTEVLLAGMTQPVIGQALAQVLAQQARERQVFERYQQVRKDYVRAALRNMGMGQSGKTPPL